MTQNGTPGPETITFTWVARGFTDDVTECQHCGRVDLKGTVRMEATGPDGDNEGETYMGVVCAARMTGRKAGEIRTEANRADRERTEGARAVWNAWNDAKTTWTVATTIAAVGPIGRDVSPLTWMEFQRTDEFKAAKADWLTANPQPVRP